MLVLRIPHVVVHGPLNLVGSAVMHCCCTFMWN